MKKILSFIALIPFVAPSIAFAQLPPAPGPEECSKAMQTDLKDVHDTYRSFVFGSREVTGGKFEVLTGGFTDRERKGIFETQRRLTSELVTPLVETYRVYRCRSLDVCALLDASFDENGGQVDLQPLGCAKVTVNRYPECFFGPAGDSPGSPGEKTSLRKQCQAIMEQTFKAEELVLRLAVAYDAGYRSMLQMSGVMDWMLEAFPTAALKAISEMVNMLGKLHEIPCFIGQCDNPRSDYLKP